MDPVFGAAAGDWTLRLDDYITEFRDARLIPPINAVGVEEHHGRPVLRIDVSEPPSFDQRLA